MPRAQEPLVEKKTRLPAVILSQTLKLPWRHKAPWFLDWGNSCFARCGCAWLSFCPVPEIASGGLPSWLRAALGPASVSTVKVCQRSRPLHGGAPMPVSAQSSSAMITHICTHQNSEVVLLLLACLVVSCCAVGSDLGYPGGPAWLPLGSSNGGTPIAGWFPSQLVQR